MPEKAFEYHLWTELIAFENTDEDRGAARYLAAIPQKPDSIFLFVCAADFPFSHRGMEEEYELPPTVCSRNAHPRNEQRERQKWTNRQLRELIANLKKHGVPTYLSMFTCCYRDQYGSEWLTRHEELTECLSAGVYRLNPIAFLNDGTPCERIFAPKVGEVCRDYGFAGFHGADRFNSTGLLYRRVASDNITRNFLKRMNLKAPEYVSCPCDGNPSGQKKRMSWIWGEHRREFTRFIQDRWVEFWGAIAREIHPLGGQCLMNSAFTRGSQVAADWLGIDYKAVVEAGVDAIVCETVPLSMSNQSAREPWELFPDLHRHYHTWCIAAMQEIRASLPDTRIMFLHGCKDIVEDWDNVRQSPAGYERELFALASLAYYRRGKLCRAADGLTACLADGFSASDWEFIVSRWRAAIRPEVLASAGEMVFVWDDRMLSMGSEDYFYDYFPTVFDTLYKFKYAGFALQATAPADELEKIHEPLCVPLAHLLGVNTIKRLLQRTEPVVLIARSEFLAAYASQGEFFDDTRFAVLLLNSGVPARMKKYKPMQDHLAYNEGGSNFLQAYAAISVMPQMGIDPQLWQDVFSAVRQALERWGMNCGRPVPKIDAPAGECQLLTRTFANGRLETIVENLGIRNLTVTLKYSKPVTKPKITSSFPCSFRNVTESSVTLKTAANRGMCAVEVEPMETGQLFSTSGEKISSGRNCKQPEGTRRTPVGD